MPFTLSPRELKRLARVGAQARLAELARERAAMLRMFPDLGRASAGATAAARPRRRRGMSAAARKAVSARMKKYWAEQRKKAGK